MSGLKWLVEVAVVTVASLRRIVRTEIEVIDRDVLAIVPARQGGGIR